MSDTKIDTARTTEGGPFLSPLVQGYWRLADWNLSPRERLSFLEAHVDLGITTVDHSPIYGDYRCEALFGEALRLAPGLRERIQIVSKCVINLVSGRRPAHALKHYDSSAAGIVASVERSLTDLRTDRLDVLLLHRPDPLVDADEVVGAFRSLHDAGKVLHFGVSNFTPRQFELLQSRLDRPLVTNQVEINPLNPAVLFDGTLDLLQKLRIRPMAWSCLAGGRPFKAEPDEAADRLRGCLDDMIAEELTGWGADQLLCAWALSLPSAPLPIIGSGRLERLRAAVAALQLSLTRQQWFRILEAGQGREVP